MAAKPSKKRRPRRSRRPARQRLCDLAAWLCCDHTSPCLAPW
jgi:hypothetical protein